MGKLLVKKQPSPALRSINPLSLLCLLLAEISHKAEVLGSELKEDRATLKATKAEHQQLKEELFDANNEKEAVEKVGVAFT